MKPISITNQVQSAGTSQPLCTQCCSSECTSDLPSKLLKIDETNNKHLKKLIHSFHLQILTLLNKFTPFAFITLYHLITLCFLFSMRGFQLDLLRLQNS